MDFMLIISAVSVLLMIVIITVLYIRINYVKRTHSEEIESLRECLQKIEKDVKADKSMRAKQAKLGLPPRNENTDHTYKKPSLPREKENKNPPPITPLKTKRW
ncbi:MAG: hypothetical protein JKY51_10600 [Opitutaceae bacterium]|nr:hypothetical protein [Opitutaceae bacterium]